MTKYRRTDHKLAFFWPNRAAIFAFYDIIPRNLDRVWQVFETWAISIVSLNKCHNNEYLYLIRRKMPESVILPAGQNENFGKMVIRELEGPWLRT